MENTRTSGAKILFAEDNEVNRFYLRSLIEQHFKDVLVLEAKNGKEAVEIYEAYSPSLILLDLNMPVMGGEEAATAIKQLAETRGEDKPKIIALTGASLDSRRRLLNQDAIDDYIIKPFSADSLLDMLTTTIVHNKSTEEGSTTNISVKRESSTQQDKRHFDYEELKRSLANDQQLIDEVLTYVLASLDTFLPRFNSLIRGQNQDQIQSVAHELRGIALNARLSLLSEYSLLIENQSSFDEDFLRKHLKKVDEEINDVKPMLMAVLRE
ncbi:response regulator [Olivibacter sp. CPCC 100613]|uniref:response regulator n=1 Tax=Olivibacter sp. CPCC 100613 TaxID=3079931 RepID=UPI002FFBFE8B